jgi:hypothetical protein
MAAFLNHVTDWRQFDILLLMQPYRFVPAQALSGAPVAAPERYLKTYTEYRRLREAPLYGPQARNHSVMQIMHTAVLQRAGTLSKKPCCPGAIIWILTLVSTIH